MPNTPTGANDGSNFTSGSGQEDLNRYRAPTRVYDERVGNGALPPGMRGAQNAAYVRTPQGDEMSGNQISALLASNNPYVANARQRGVEQAGARGMLNSSAAAGSAERSAIEAAAPLAMQQAEAFTGAAADNQQYLNQLASEERQIRMREWETQASLAAAGNASMDRLQLQREQLAFEGEQSGLDRAHQNYRDYTGDQYDENATERRSHYGQQDYAFRMGMDMSVQRQELRAQLAARVIEDPEMFPPEMVEALDSSLGPWMDEGWEQFMERWGTGQSRGNRRGGGRGNSRGGGQIRTGGQGRGY